MELMLGRDRDALMKCDIKRRYIMRLAFNVTMTKKSDIQLS